jgi:hypothetical protein
MQARVVVPVGHRRPGRARSDDGAVSVEAAIALLALVVALALVMWSLVVLAAHLSAAEAARSAARLAARGEDSAVVIAEARRTLPDSDVAVTEVGQEVRVEVRRSVTPPGILARWGEITVVGAATAAQESAP